jgi:hypothetical protein
MKRKATRIHIRRLREPPPDARKNRISYVDSDITTSQRSDSNAYASLNPGGPTMLSISDKSSLNASIQLGSPKGKLLP